MHPFAQERADRYAGIAAALAYWVAAVVFVAGVSLLSGWLPQPPATAAPTPTQAPPQPTSRPTPTAVSEVEQLLETGASVVFPAPVERSERLVDISGVEATVVVYSASTAGGATYNLAVVEYPPHVDLSDPAVNLLSSVSGAAGSVGGRVVAQTPRVVQGTPAVVFEIEIDDVRLQGRNLLHDRHLYTQNVAYEGAPPDDVRDFFRSLELPGD